MKNCLKVIFYIWFFCLISGCMDKPYFLLSSSDKFNKSFPPPAEVRIAKEDFRVLVDQNKELLINFDEAYEKHLDIRALSCTKNLSIGRFYSQRKKQKSQQQPFNPINCKSISHHATARSPYPGRGQRKSM